MTKPTDNEMIAFIDKEMDGAERGLFKVLPEHLSMVKAIRDRIASLTPDHIGDAASMVAPKISETAMYGRTLFAAQKLLSAGYTRHGHNEESHQSNR